MHGLTFEKTLPKALLQAEALPSLPSVAIAVLRLCEDEDVALDDLARAIEHDPALVARMLKLANSARLGHGLAVTTMQRAAVVLGLDAVQHMALSFSLAQALPRRGAGRFDYAGFWHRSLVAAVAARALAARGLPGREDELFLCGLLALIGQLALAECLPALYADVVDASAPRWPTLELKRSTLGFHSADVAGALLASWDLPDAIVLPVAYAERPDEAPAAHRRAAEICGLAHAAAGIVCEADNASHSVALEAGMRRVLGASASDVEAFLAELGPALDEAAALLSIEIADPAARDEVLARARARVAAPSERVAPPSRASYLDERSLELARAAYVDPETDLPNHAAFEHALRSEVRRRLGARPRCLGLLLIELEGLDAVRAADGPGAADSLVRALAEALRGTTRKSDLIARLKGARFAAILPETSPGLLRMVANRIRRAAAPLSGRDPRVAVAIAGACLARASAEPDGARLLALCERLLAGGRERGRNRVVIHAHTRLAPAPREDGEAA